MSNVLIGIICVILFIGLAPAGGRFLGPRFQESTNNSRASASVQAVSQIASAANMFEVQEGRIAAVISDAVVDNDDLVERGYLKRSEEHTSELQSLMRISYAVFCLKKKKKTTQSNRNKL